MVRGELGLNYDSHPSLTCFLAEFSPWRAAFLSQIIQFYPLLNTHVLCLALFSQIVFRLNAISMKG